MFKDRFHAGDLLLEKIIERGYDKSLSFLFAIPRGGIEVAYPIAKSLKKEIIPLLVHKIPSSSNEEFAVGAVASSGDYILNDYGRDESLRYIQNITTVLERKLKKMEEFFGTSFDYKNIQNKIIAIIDDGIATGETVFLSVKIIKRYNPKEVLVIAPVSSLDGFERVSEVATVICPVVDSFFFAVSAYFEEFLQVSEEVARRYIVESREFAK